MTSSHEAQKMADSPHQITGKKLVATEGGVESVRVGRGESASAKRRWAGQGLFSCSPASEQPARGIESRIGTVHLPGVV
jgi:hypothetical protein